MYLRELESMCSRGRDRGRGREGESQADSLLSAGFHLTPLRSWPEPKSRVGCLIDWTTQVPLFVYFSIIHVPKESRHTADVCWLYECLSLLWFFLHNLFWYLPSLLRFLCCTLEALPSWLGDSRRCLVVTPMPVFLLEGRSHDITFTSNVLNFSRQLVSIDGHPQLSAIAIYMDRVWGWAMGLYILLGDLKFF